MTGVASSLASAGWTLRTGGDSGPDAAFAVGAGDGPVDRFLPYTSFNGQTDGRVPSTAAFARMAAIHDSWDGLIGSDRQWQAH